MHRKTRLQKNIEKINQERTKKIYEKIISLMPSSETILKLTKNNKFEFMLPGIYEDLYYVDEIINAYVKRRYGLNFIFYYSPHECWFSTDKYYKCWIDWNKTKTKLQVTRL